MLIVKLFCVKEVFKTNFPLATSIFFSIITNDAKQCPPHFNRLGESCLTAVLAQE